MTAYATVEQLRQYLPQVPELGQQTIAIAGPPSAGTFTLSYEGVSTGALAYNASATSLQTALRGITAIGSTGVNVRGQPGGPWVATFQGALATDAGPLSADAALLTPASTVAIEPSTDSLLGAVLDRATDTIRTALRALLADPTFDYAPWGAASTKIVIAPSSYELRLPAYQAGSVTLIENQTGSVPSTYTALDSNQWEEIEGGAVYRSSGWAGLYFSGAMPRYRVTAIWGYGPTPPDSIVELCLEIAVNIWRSRDKGGFSEVVGVEGGGAIRQVAGLNKGQIAVLEAIRDQLIAIGV